MTEERIIPTSEHPEPSTIRDFAFGELHDLEEQRRVQTHLEDCEACRSIFLELSETYGSSVEVDEPTTGFLMGDLDGPEGDPGGLPSMPSEIGHLRVLRRLGSGGMSHVYLAEDTHVRRKVAVKVLRHSLASTDTLRRFRMEARIIARLDHPGINRLYDMGVTDDEVPYLAVEYVPGLSIIEHCRKHGLGTRERLGLMTQVCDAVASAHRMGVVHRDLKPSNIIVTPDGVPKVIDFGVSKLVDSLAEGDTIFTLHGQLIGTPSYMSPEQAVGEELDASSDVYALGVVLYELLCDRLPHELRSHSLGAMQRVLGETEPARPSVIDRSLRGDLETITLKCLEKRRVARYPSASDLADDIRRYLCDEPIHARPPSAAYMMRKFVRRNRVSAIVAAAFLVTVTTIVIALTWAAATTTARPLAIDSPIVAEFLRDPAAVHALLVDDRCDIGPEIAANIWARPHEGELLLLVHGLPEGGRVACQLRRVEPGEPGENGESSLISEISSNGKGMLVARIGLGEQVSADRIIVVLIGEAGLVCTLQPVG